MADPQAIENKLRREQALKGLRKMLNELEAAAVKRIREAADSGEMSRKYYRDQEKKIRKIYKDIETKWASYVKNQFPNMWDEAKAIARRIIRSAGITDATRARIGQGTLDIIMQDTVALMTKGGAAGMDEVSRLFREARARLLREEEINKAIAKGLMEGAQKPGMNEIEKKLRAKFGEGKLLNINGRQYRPETYAELLARTRGAEAQTQASINTCLEYGVDLVRVTTHNTDTEICIPYEKKNNGGGIFSITGTNPEYPSFQQWKEPFHGPPFHPNSYHPDMLLLLHTENGIDYVRAEDAYNNRNKYLIAPDLDPYTMGYSSMDANQIMAWFRHKPDEWYDIKGDGFRQIVTWNHNIPVWSIDGDKGQREYKGFAKAYQLSKLQHLFVASHECYTSRLVPVSELDIAIKPANEYAYCLDVGGHHCVLVKYGEATSWSGNCQHAIYPYIPVQARTDDENLEILRSL